MTTSGNRGKDPGTIRQRNVEIPGNPIIHPIPAIQPFFVRPRLPYPDSPRYFFIWSMRWIICSAPRGGVWYLAFRALIRQGICQDASLAHVSFGNHERTRPWNQSEDPNSQKLPILFSHGEKDKYSFGFLRYEANGVFRWLCLFHHYAVHRSLSFFLWPCPWNLKAVLRSVLSYWPEISRLMKPWFRLDAPSHKLSPEEYRSLGVYHSIRFNSRSIILTMWANINAVNDSFISILNLAHSCTRSFLLFFHLGRRLLLLFSKGESLDGGLLLFLLFLLIWSSRPWS